jgi:hypothetical protein
VKILYWAVGLLIYLILIALITKILEQNSLRPEQRRMDRRENTKDRRMIKRDDSAGSRRIKERRSMARGILA